MRVSFIVAAAAFLTVGPANAQVTVKDEWMQLCTQFPGQSEAYCDCTFNSVGGRLTVNDMAILNQIIGAYLSVDAAVFGQVMNQLGLDQQGIAAWDQRAEQLFNIADQECIAFAPAG